MRATLWASSSISAEPPLAGSDGALTVTPQFAILARGSGVARHGLQNLRWTLLVTAARRTMWLARNCGRAASAARLTLLWSYCSTRAFERNCLNWQQFRPSGE